MKSDHKIFTIYRVRTLPLLAAIALSMFSLAYAGGSIPATIAKKLDAQIVLALKQSRGEPPFDKPTSLYPDIPIMIQGRALVDIKATVSSELLDGVALVGGQVVKGSEKATTLQAWVPLQKMEILAARPEVKFISPARPVGTSRIKP